MSDPPTPGGRIAGADLASKQGEPSEAGPSDLEAVTRAAEGDHDAFRVLVERYQDRAYGLALRVMRDEEQARDVFRQALIAARAAYYESAKYPIVEQVSFVDFTF